jgi:hypothetical protein
VSNKHVQTVDVADDQNSAWQTRRLKFVAADSEVGWRTCVKCVAHNNRELCDRLPCNGRQRADGSVGYFQEVAYERLSGRSFTSSSAVRVGK